MIIKRNGFEIESSYASILAEYAIPHSFENRPGDTDNRATFQRDRDRIIHSESFRKLMYKTQVFVNHEGDSFRTRLTHTLEVSQIARGVCKSLALNEDLAEAISLGHDLGHTPFGHAVEDFFNSKLECGFRHNEQSVRVACTLETRNADNGGLQLSEEVLEGILKHTDSREYPYFPHLNPKHSCSHLEGQIVAIVDTIAYTCHDLEDAIKSGIVYQSLKQNDVFKKAFKKIKEQISDTTGVEIDGEQYQGAYFIREIIHKFVVDLTDNTAKNLGDYGIKSLADVKATNYKIADLSAEYKELLKIMGVFLVEHVYQSHMISIMDHKAVMVVEKMFERFMDNPKLLPPNWFSKYCNADDLIDPYSMMMNSKVRVICDYISCMTDRSALDEYERLTNPKIKL
ncbi:MAG: dNTP triphosphohydrolase [Defluviitaleaceae bacterium]|nr:dNTP triphosphohydrolase [Defluviitaleaceae bacterium]